MSSDGGSRWSSSRHPDEFLLLFLCLISGARLVFGDAPTPGSVEDSVPGWASIAWGLGLLIGPVTVFVGIMWLARHRASGILVEQAGQVITGGVALFYAVALGVSAGAEATLPVSIVLAFSLARLWRWVQLERIIRSAQDRADTS